MILTAKESLYITKSSRIQNMEKILKPIMDKIYSRAKEGKFDLIVNCDSGLLNDTIIEHLGELGYKIDCTKSSFYDIISWDNDNI